MRSSSKANYRAPSKWFGGDIRQVSSGCYDHTSHYSQGLGSQPNPTRAIRDYERLLGLIRPSWEDLAPLVEALMACMK